MQFTRRQALTGAATAAAISTLGGCKKIEVPSDAADLIKLDGVAQAGLIRDGHMTAREAVEAALKRIEAVEPRINAFVDVAAEQALEAADALSSDAPYAGLPFALKDLNDYPGMKFEMGSAMFKDRMGKNKTPYTQKIDESGVIIIGKTTTPEFGLVGTTEPLAYKPSRNPWNLDHSVGGSSGGAGAAVAARIMPIAQASDGGGSIRNPAAICGVVGLKPSRGRFPDQGNVKREIEISIKHAVSLSVRDNALMLALTEAENGPLETVGLVNPGKVEPKRIAMTIDDVRGLPPHRDCAAAVERTARMLVELGHKVDLVEKGPELSRDIYDDFIILWGQSVVPIVEAAGKMAGKPARESGLLEGWTLDIAERYQALDDVRIRQGMDRLNAMGRQLRDWLDGYDAWLTPSTSMPAPELGWTRGDLTYDQNLERSAQLVGHLSLHNVAGTPGISIPAGLSGGLPIAIQLSGKLGSERTLLELSYQLEEAMPWMDKLPPVVAG